ncbi:hypothetical protein GUITHDRAFT_155103 [Guillardia theta CCMP2712]|uniref:Uncharacterized protein n=1 Tax=Guillardia theta (strain CCMP2712) TaxID=905079 RepID=L1IKX3_GUITC|nr:hypothetical protein GUITHDRAFT_155103 [Guillardia theta CCMP2712]EKX36903.1 hypothetical protein GUITHDRAFT_155103 [Guillardia theta CCMP2712]|mmetsp:Transcript_8921/g.29825  ORF Transcript_8921/g.29825 Transcript_8921/m.29825 type:complete len:122 (+) Transcript_8921:335-700(+)|eukprot:XP_005823883.1 hypothetical protein GUITHDRAFT_155103 [Guillardia theta CCMP2712]
MNNLSRRLVSQTVAHQRRFSLTAHRITKLYVFGMTTFGFTGLGLIFAQRNYQRLMYMKEHGIDDFEGHDLPACGCGAGHLPCKGSSSIHHHHPPSTLRHFVTGTEPPHIELMDRWLAPIDQ